MRQDDSDSVNEANEAMIVVLMEELAADFEFEGEEELNQIAA